MNQFLDGINRRAPATDAIIAESEKQLPGKLPLEYVEFLKLTNGAEGFVGRAYVMLWSVEELASMNHSYEVQDYAPGLLIFGSDGGGEPILGGSPTDPANKVMLTREEHIEAVVFWNKIVKNARKKSGSVPSGTR
jgi:hypothetical protein